MTNSYCYSGHARSAEVTAEPHICAVWCFTKLTSNSSSSNGTATRFTKCKQSYHLHEVYALTALCPHHLCTSHSNSVHTTVAGCSKQWRGLKQNPSPHTAVARRCERIMTTALPTSLRVLCAAVLLTSSTLSYRHVALATATDSGLMEL
eukprot:9834-Heterococcus_DN1.PRE.9